MTTTFVASRDQYPGSLHSGQPARLALAVTPSDTKDLTDATGDAMPAYAKALYIGVAGNVTVVTAGRSSDDNTVTFTAHPAGYMPVQVRRVLATGTTATNIVALIDQ